MCMYSRGWTFGVISVEAWASNCDSEGDNGRAAPCAKDRSKMKVKRSVNGECMFVVVIGILSKLQVVDLQLWWMGQ